MGLFKKSTQDPGMAVERFRDQLREPEACGMLPGENLLDVWPNPFGYQIFILTSLRVASVSEKVQDLREEAVGLRSKPDIDLGWGADFKMVGCQYTPLRYLVLGEPPFKHPNVIPIHMTPIATCSTLRLIQKEKPTRFEWPEGTVARVNRGSKEHSAVMAALNAVGDDAAIDWVRPHLIKCPKCGESDPAFRLDGHTTVSGNLWSIQSSTSEFAVFVCKRCQIDLLPLTRQWL